MDLTDSLFRSYRKSTLIFHKIIPSIYSKAGSRARALDTTTPRYVLSFSGPWPDACAFDVARYNREQAHRLPRQHTRVAATRTCAAPRHRRRFTPLNDVFTRNARKYEQEATLKSGHPPLVGAETSSGSLITLTCRDPFFRRRFSGTNAADRRIMQIRPLLPAAPRDGSLHLERSNRYDTPDVYGGNLTSRRGAKFPNGAAGLEKRINIAERLYLGSC